MITRYFPYASLIHCSTITLQDFLGSVLANNLPLPHHFSIYNNPMKLVPLYEGDQNIGLAPYTDNLDKDTGVRRYTGAPGCHLGIDRLDDGRYYACYSSDWPEGVVRRKKDDGTYEILFRCPDDFGPTALAVVITEEEAKGLIREHDEELYGEMFGE
jgi:hypothetical protein